MLENRIASRVRQLGLGSYEAYLKKVMASTSELRLLIDSVTTNFTSFFRDSQQFEHLQKELEARLEPRPKRIRIWSAACSSGEEPYSLAMTAAMAQRESGVTVSPIRILATDISDSVLHKASSGCYSAEKVASIPSRFRDFFEPLPGEELARFQAKQMLREPLIFRRINLCDSTWDIPDGIDFVFIRNVLLYFDRDTQQAILRRCVQKMKPGGLLYVGACENVRSLVVGVDPVMPSVFRKHAVTDMRSVPHSVHGESCVITDGRPAHPGSRTGGSRMAATGTGATSH